MKTWTTLARVVAGGDPERVQPFASERRRPAAAGGQREHARHPGNHRRGGVHRAYRGDARRSACGRGSADIWKRCCFKEGAEVRKAIRCSEIDPRTYQADYDRAVANLAQARAHLTHLEANYKRARPDRDAGHQPGGFRPGRRRPRRGRGGGQGGRSGPAHRRSQPGMHPRDGPHQRPHQPAIDRSGQPGQGRRHGADDDRLPGPHVRLLRRRRADHVADPPAGAGRKGEVGPRGQDAKVLLGLADEEGFPHAGTINFIDNQVDIRPARCGCRGLFPNPNRILSPGMFVRIQVPIGDPHPSLLGVGAGPGFRPGAEVPLCS